MPRRQVTPTSFAFLDIMFCGFGAVVLLVMILNGDVLRKRERQSEDLRAEYKRATLLEQFARERLQTLGHEVQEVELQEADARRKSEEIERQIRDTGASTREAERQSADAQQSIASIQGQSAALERAITLLREKAAAQWDGGRKLVGFSGDGQRQYLTGLKLGGQRTLILLDSSASMLDETLVNVIRRKVTEPAAKRAAPKWQRTVRTLHWLIANLRPGRQFQIYRFGVDAAPLVAGTDGKWLSTDDAPTLAAALAAARTIVPDGGTSLHRAFAAARNMSPPPDSIILLTDGLPTQAMEPGRLRLVPEDERAGIFLDALHGLPPGVPVNTLLFPMEGDPSAAGLFWQLAITTKGSFITPSRDWP